MGDKTLLVIEYAKANGGIVTTREAQALGMERTTLARRARAGVFTRVQRGVFALPSITDTFGVDLDRACRRLNAVVSHHSAGELHRFDGLPWAPPSVTVPHRFTNSFPGVYVHQSTDISDQDVVVVRGLRVTSPERTIIDLAAVIGDGRLDWILDRALAAGLVDLSKLSELFSSLARRGKPGTTRVRRLLEKRDQSFTPPDSVLERHLLGIIEHERLPTPNLQFRPPWLVPTDGRVDFAYPDQRLIIEGDGRKWHLLMKSFETDRQRDNLAQLAGWRILRFTWRDITERPESVGEMIRAALVL